MKTKKRTKSKSGSIGISRELFIETLNEIKQQSDHDNKCYEAFSIILNQDYISSYDNHWLQSQLIKLLKIAFKDDHRDSWIEYFIWDLEFGKKYRKGGATYKNGTNIDLSDAGKLYDFLIKS